jgi:hypothetical protein
MRRAHICASGRYFCEFGKDGKVLYQTVGVVFFSSFAKKIRMPKSFAKLLELLASEITNSSVKNPFNRDPPSHPLAFAVLLN